MEYSAIMAAALAEFRAWDQRRPSLTIYTETVAFRRPTRKPPCACGRLHCAKGLCRRCYDRAYNSTRSTPRRGRRRPHYSRDYKRKQRANQRG